MRFLFCLFEISHKIQQITVSWLYTNKQGNNKDLSSQRGTTCACVCLWSRCVCVCFGFRGAEDMIACGRWPETLPLQKPRDVTASCIDASHTWTNTHTHAHTLGGSLLSQSQTNSWSSSQCCDRDIKVVEAAETWNKGCLNKHQI